VTCMPVMRAKRRANATWCRPLPMEGLAVGARRRPSLLDAVHGWYLLPLPPGIKNLLRPSHVVHHAVAPPTGHYSVMKVWGGDMRVGTSRHLTSLVRDAPPTEAGAPARDILHVGRDAGRELCSARLAIPLHAFGLSRVTYRCGPAIGVTLQRRSTPLPPCHSSGCTSAPVTSESW
jgi:hypothetical protein